MDIKKIMVRPKQFPDTFLDMYSEVENSNDQKTMCVTFVVTEDCMLKCSYCYQNCKTKNKMTIETGKKIIDMLFEQSETYDGYINSNNSKAIILEFIGGEPLLEIELIDQIVEYFKYKAIALNHPWQTKYMISISTNGILYEDQRVEDFLERNNGRISIGITIDGDKELHDSCRVFPNGDGSYDIVASAFKKHLSKNFAKHTKMTLSPENLPYLFTGSVHLYNEIGLAEIAANCIFEKGWTAEHAKIFYSELKKLADWLLTEQRYEYKMNSLFESTIGSPLPEEDNQNWCGGTGKMLGISADGKFYPCLRYMPFSLKENSPSFDIGDCNKGIGHTNEQRARIEELKSVTRKSQSTDECFLCPIARGCAWCSAYNFEEFGTVNKRTTYICIMHKARVLANAYYWNKLYREINSSDRFEMHVPKEWATEIISEDEYNMLLELSI